MDPCDRHRPLCWLLLLPQRQFLLRPTLVNVSNPTRWSRETQFQHMHLHTHVLRQGLRVRVARASPTAQPTSRLTPPHPHTHYMRSACTHTHTPPHPSQGLLGDQTCHDWPACGLACKRMHAQARARARTRRPALIRHISRHGRATCPMPTARAVQLLLAPLPPQPRAAGLSVPTACLAKSPA